MCRRPVTAPRASRSCAPPARAQVTQVYFRRDRRRRQRDGDTSISVPRTTTKTSSRPPCSTTSECERGAAVDRFESGSRSWPLPLTCTRSSPSPARAACASRGAASRSAGSAPAGFDPGGERGKPSSRLGRKPRRPLDQHLSSMRSAGGSSGKALRASSQKQSTMAGGATVWQPKCYNEAGNRWSSKALAVRSAEMRRSLRALLDDLRHIPNWRSKPLADGPA